MSIIPTQNARIRRKGALHLAFDKLFSEPFGMNKLETYSERFVPNAEADLATVSAEAPTPFRRHLKIAAFWTAIGSAALGAAANIYAFERYNSGENASLTGKMEINRDIENLNTVAIVFYSLAGVAAATWLTLTLWPDESEKGVDVTVLPDIGVGKAGLGVIIQIDY
jgi:hypothetical protein